MAQADPEALGAERHDNGLEEALLSARESSKAASGDDCKSLLLWLLVDVVSFSLFLYIMPYWSYYSVWLGLLLVGSLWRGLRLGGDRDRVLEDSNLPHRVGFFEDETGRRLYLVATVHISPQSKKDAEDVIRIVRPDVVMIELDEERLDNMRSKKVIEPPKLEDLQLLKLAGAGIQQEFGESPVSIHTQRAIWNAERCGEKLSGKLLYDESNTHGLQRPCDEARGNLILIRRGPPGPTGSTAPNLEATFPVKAHLAAKAGVKAIVVVDTGDQLPSHRLGASGSLSVEMKIACRARSCGFPPIPCVMVSKTHGERLIKLCAPTVDGRCSVDAEIEVMDDKYPRRTLPRHLCQGCMLFGSGIGILYMIIRCFDVEAGGEFFAAEKAASAQDVPCVCIDVDMNRLWSRVGSVSIPTPRNVWRVIRTWVAFPRAALSVLLPRTSNTVDTLGSIGVHAKSFSLRTWIAFIIAGFVASFVSTSVLNFLSGEVTAGAVHEKIVKKHDSADFQVILLNLLLLYLMPCLYEAILVSRDQAMYEGICAKARSNGSRCMVAVTGAAHTNGILQRCRDRGLG